MAVDNPRVLELRRRVQSDPASIAFAQLAEECRRLGEAEDAVGISRAGLTHHPDYLSARVTLGRALLELGRLDEAHAELKLVVVEAPDNLPANRALAELYQTRGQVLEALVHYKRTLELARYDPGLEHRVERTENVVSLPPPAPPILETAPAVEEVFDFDRLLERFGAHRQPIATPATTQSEALALPVIMTPSEVDAVRLREDDGDPFSVLERQLRDTDEQRSHENLDARGHDGRDRRVMAELEGWLEAIITDREPPPSV